MSDVAHAIKSQLFFALILHFLSICKEKSTVSCEPSQHQAGVGGEARRATALHHPLPADVSAETRCEAVGSTLQVSKKPILSPSEVGDSPKQSKIKLKATFTRRRGIVLRTRKGTY